MDTGQGGSRTVRLRGAGGIVDRVVASVFADLMQPLPPCNPNTECFELSDDAALEVNGALQLQRALMIVWVSRNHSRQATREACSPVQLQQLLQPDLYPDNHASVLRAKAEKELKEQQRRVTLQRNLVIGAALGIALVCIVVLCSVIAGAAEQSL